MLVGPDHTSNFNLIASLIFRMNNLYAAIWTALNC